MSRHTKGRILGERSGRRRDAAWRRLWQQQPSEETTLQTQLFCSQLHPGSDCQRVVSGCMSTTSDHWQVSRDRYQLQARTGRITISSFAPHPVELYDRSSGSLWEYGGPESSIHRTLRKHGARSLALRSDTKSLNCPTTCGTRHRSSNLWSIKWSSNESHIMNKDLQCSKLVKISPDEFCNRHICLFLRKAYLKSFVFLFWKLFLMCFGVCLSY